MASHPEVAGPRGSVLARSEHPRVGYATPGVWPGGLARLDGGNSRRSTVMRLCPSGQPAYIRVIRRRSRRLGHRPDFLRTVVQHHGPRRPLRHAVGRAAGAGGAATPGGCDC